MITLVIAVSSNRDWKSSFGRSMVAAAVLLSTYYREDIEPIFMFYNQVSLLSCGRQRAIDDAIKKNADYLLMIDDDISFDPKIINDMLGRSLPVVCANYVSKGSGKSVTKDLNDEVLSSKGKTGFQEISRTGLGFCLIDVDVIRNIPRPHFQVMWSEEFTDYTGEDYFFFKLLKENGVKIFIDHDASQFIGHAGDKIYKEE